MPRGIGPDPTVVSPGAIWNQLRLRRVSMSSFEAGIVVHMTRDQRRKGVQVERGQAVLPHRPGKDLLDH
jgi:hypothetical protein